MKMFNENKGFGVINPLTSACKFNKTIESKKYYSNYDHLFNIYFIFNVYIL